MYKRSGINNFRFLWGAVAVSPFAYVFLALRFLISFISTTLLVIFDTVKTIFKTFWNFLKDLFPWILIVVVITIVLFLIHAYWPEFVDILNRYILPAIEFVWNEVIKFLWDILIKVILNLLIWVWDSLVQLIGFAIYFAFNFIVTVMGIIIDLIGTLDLPSLFSDLMEIVTPLLQMATEMLKVLITIGTALISKMIPIIMAVVKMWFEYIKIAFKVWSFIFVTLFRALGPILQLVVAVTKAVAKLFRIKARSTARMMLSVVELARHRRTLSKGGKEQDPFGTSQGASDNNTGYFDDPGLFLLTELYSAATQYYTQAQYSGMLGALEYVHKGIRAEDVYHSTAGYYIDPGQSAPDYTHHIYDEDDLHDHELRPGRHTGERVVPIMREQQLEREEEREAVDDLAEFYQLDEKVKRHLLQWKGIDVSKLDASEQHNLEKKRLDFIGSLFGEDEQEQRDDGNESGSGSASSSSSSSDPEQEHEPTPASNETVQSIYAYADPYAVIHPDDHWKIDYTHNMTSEQVFPLLRGKKLKRPKLHELHSSRTIHQLHEQRKRAVAYTHALQSAYYKAYKKHIHSGHFHKVAKQTFKHLTGHDDPDTWFKSFQTRYVSAGHFLYENVPSTHSNGLLRAMWRACPDYDKRAPFHHWIEREYGSLNISREHWEASAIYEEAKEKGMTHDENNLDEAMGPLTRGDAFRAGTRKLMADFFAGLKINLEILYLDDCFNTPRRNILCLPFIPDSWIIPRINITSLVLTKDLNNNTMCEPVWKSTDCIVCWDGIWNMIQGIRFLWYVADLISLILIFGIFTPRPTEYLGYLGDLNPIFKFIVDLMLIYDVGYFPNGTQWACFFINFFYLWQAFLLMLIIYYFIDPMVDLFIRTWRSYMTLVVIYRMSMATRRQLMEQFDEDLLASVNGIYRKADLSRRQIKQGQYGARIQSEINSPAPVSASKEIRITVDDDTSSSSSSNSSSDSDMPEEGHRRFDRYRSNGENRDQIIELTALEMENEATRLRVAEKMDVLAAKIGAQVNFASDEHRHASRAHQSWNSVTHVLQMPYQTTPAFNAHLRAHHDNMRDNAAPPGAHAFPSPHENLVKQNTKT